MSTRSILGLIYMVQGLQQLGEDPGPVLRKHGLDPDQLDPSTRIERARELRIYADLAERLHDPMLGLRLGGFYGLAGYGPLVMLIMTCANAWEAFQMGVKYQRLTYLFGTLRLEPGERLSALVLSPMPMAPRAFRFRVDGEVSGTYKMVRDMQATMGLDIHADRIDMPYPRPRQAGEYEDYFNAPVRFGESEARFWLRNDHLQLRFPSADAAAHSMYRTMCDQQLQAQQASEGRDTLAERVSAHLALFNSGFPASEDVAKALDLSERSLRRQLADEGQSFRDLLAQARHAKARELLSQTTLPVEAVAQQLGYAEAAAFTRAFQRWQGMTPSAWRQHQRVQQTGTAP